MLLDESTFVTLLVATVHFNALNSSGKFGKSHGGAGQLLSGSCKNEGPDNQYSNDFPVVAGLVPTSAGFEAPSKNLHCEGSLISSICDNLFATKTGNRLVELRIIKSTTKESVQKIESVTILPSSARSHRSSGQLQPGNRNLFQRSQT